MDQFQFDLATQYLEINGGQGFTGKKSLTQQAIYGYVEAKNRTNQTIAETTAKKNELEEFVDMSFSSKAISKEENGIEAPEKTNLEKIQDIQKGIEESGISNLKIPQIEQIKIL